MNEPIDWSVTTHEGNRRRQHEEFRALPFREKLARIEEMGEVAAFFESRRRARSASGSGSHDSSVPGSNIPPISGAANVRRDAGPGTR